MAWFAVANRGSMVRAQAGEQDTPRIRLDAVVTGIDGEPLRGLTRDDFDLLIRGERRVIEAFREVTREPEAAGGGARLPADMPLDVATNALGVSDRLVVFAIENRSDAAVRAAAVGMLDAIHPDVPVGLAFAGGAPGMELTLDRVRLRAAIERPPDTVLSESLVDTSPWIGLTDAALALTDGDRRRRAFVFIGPGVAQPLAPAARAELEAAARDAGVSVYAWEPAGRGVHPQVLALTRETGGRVLTGRLPAVAMAEVLGDFDHHYLLSIAARPGEDVASLADIAVHVRREQAVVRPRLGPHDDAPRSRPFSERESGSWEFGVVPRSGVGMRAVATPFPPAGNRVPVAVLLEMTVPRAPLEAVDALLADEIDWTVDAVNLLNGQVRGERRTDDVAALRPRGTDPARHDAVQFELQSWLNLEPGPHQVRVSATSRALGIGGSVYLTLDVPDAGGPVSIGGFVFGHPAPESELEALRVQGLVLDNDLRGRIGGSNALSLAGTRRESRIPIRAAVNRSFDRWEELKLFFEVGRRRGGDAIAADVQITDVLGRIVHSSRPVVEDRDRTRITIDVPLVTLVPGVYRVSARVDTGETIVRRDAAFVVNGVPPTLEALAAMTPGGVADGAVTAPAPPETAAAGDAASDREGPLRLRPDLSAAEGLRARVEADRLAAEGWERYQQGDVEGAQARLAESIAIGNDSPQAHYALGLAEFALGRHEASVAAFEFARRRQPDHQPVYFDLTDAYRALGRTDDALAVLRDGARRWPADAEIYNAMGVVHFNRGELDEAIRALERAIEVAPADGLGYFNLARAYQARMIRWQAERGVQMLTAARALADRDRQRAIDAYTRALALGGSFEWDAREALRTLGGG